MINYGKEAGWGETYTGGQYYYTAAKRGRSQRKLNTFHWTPMPETDTEDQTAAKENKQENGRNCTDERHSCEVQHWRWKWIGHVLRREGENDCTAALGWSPQGWRARGRPKMTWRRTVEKERIKAGWVTWNMAKAATIWSPSPPPSPPQCA